MTTYNLKGKLVVGYCRTSMFESVDTTNQKALINYFVKDAEGELMDIYEDDGISGTTLFRPQLNRLIEEGSKEGIDTVVVCDVSRLGRSAAILAAVMEELSHAGMHIIAINDSTTASLLNSLTDAFHQYELAIQRSQSH